MQFSLDGWPSFLQAVSHQEARSDFNTAPRAVRTSEGVIFKATLPVGLVTHELRDFF